MEYWGIVAVFILVVSGCSGIGGTGTTSSTAIEATSTHIPEPSQRADRLVIQTGELRFNGSKTVDRVVGMLGTDVSYIAVSIVPQAPKAPQTCSRSNFYRALRVQCDVSNFSRPVGGIVHQNTSSITLWVADSATNSEVESVFAHEITHVIQRHRGISYDALGTDTTTDRGLVHRLLIEGQAEYIETEYEQRFHRSSGNDALEKYNSLIGLQAAGAYYFGELFFDAKFDTPESSWHVFNDPPTTTERILHPESSNSTPLPLSVSNESNVRIQSRDTLGELAIRNALRSRLPESQAATAAAGWGNDEVLRITTSNATGGFVWITRWDSEKDAREFSVAMTEYSTHANASDDRIVTTRTSATVVTVTVGVDGVQIVPANNETWLVTLNASTNDDGR